MDGQPGLSSYQHSGRIESFSSNLTSVFIRSVHEENCYCRADQTAIIISRSVDTISISIQFADWKDNFSVCLCDDWELEVLGDKSW